jgi:hypothetical protein
MDVSEELVASDGRISQARNHSEAGSKQSPACFLISCLASYSTLKMKVTCTSETAVNFHDVIS